MATEKFALWTLGFRPFYLLASAFAALAVVAWVSWYAGALGGVPRIGAAWHAHEMLFGYTVAVIAGFLFTAVRAWTGEATPSGRLLAAIVILWVAGRILMLTPFALAAGVVNALFPLAVAAGIAVPLIASRNRRNYFFIPLLAGIAAAILLYHLAALSIVDWPAHGSLKAGLDIVLFIVAVVAGRVIPMFTNNGVPGAAATRRPWLEKASLASLLVVLALDVALVEGAWIAGAAVVAAALHACRLWLWNPGRTLRAPLVWVLHAAYAWIPAHLVLRALAEMGWIASPPATHALTIGVIGGMTLGMMTRTARGHTGLALEAGKAEIVGYILINLAAIVRVFGALAVPSSYRASVVISGLLFAAAFAIYAVRYWPILTRPRAEPA